MCRELLGLKKSEFCQLINLNRNFRLVSVCNNDAIFRSSSSLIIFCLLLPFEAAQTSRISPPSWQIRFAYMVYSCLLKMTVLCSLHSLRPWFQNWEILRERRGNCKRFSYTVYCSRDALLRSQGRTRKHSTTLLSLPREDICTPGDKLPRWCASHDTRLMHKKLGVVLKIGQQVKETRQTTLLRNAYNKLYTQKQKLG